MTTCVEPDLGQWLLDSSSNISFVAKMRVEYSTRGSLTERQWMALKRIRAEQAAVVMAPERRAVAELQNGRHAVLVGDQVQFYVVRTADDGKYRGTTFIARQSGDVRQTVGYRRPDGELVRRTSEVVEFDEMVRQILEEPMVTLARYGREIGSCGVCGRALTDEVSRDRGIGPVCFERLAGAYGEAA